MYRYFDKATEPDGDIAVGTLLDICVDEAGTMASIYSRGGVWPPEIDNPYTVDEGGYVDLWAHEPVLYWRLHGTSNTPKPLARVSGIGSTDVFNVKDYGAAGDGMTDDTDAIASAFADAMAYNNIIETGGAICQGYYIRPVVYFPPGCYKTAPIVLTGFRYGEIRGAGLGSTQLRPLDGTADGALIQLDEFDIDPAEWWYGTCSGVKISQMTIRNYGYENTTTYTGIRTLSGIWDSGSGSLVLDRVRITGFKYGVCCASGPDNNYFTDVDIEKCDIGLYIGPHGSQSTYEHIIIAFCDIGIYMERCTGQTSFHDMNLCECKTCMIKLDTGDADNKTLLGMSYTIPSSASYQNNVTFHNTWFETGLQDVGWTTPHGVVIGGAIYTWDGVKFYDTHVMAGEWGMGDKTPGYEYSLFLLDYTNTHKGGGKNILIDGVMWVGWWFSTLVHKNDTTVSPTVTVRGFDLVDGYELNAPQVFSDDMWGQPGVRFEDTKRYGTGYSGGAETGNYETVNTRWDGMGFKYKLTNTDQWERLRVDSNPAWVIGHSENNSSWTERIALYASGQIGFRPDDVTWRTISFGTAPPVSGTYGQGSIRFYTGATASGKVGWVCVSGGAPGTWKAFGLIDT